LRSTHGPFQNRGGLHPPKDVNAPIEISVVGIAVKYEMDKISGTLFVDRFLHAAMYYPGNDGFIPHTLSEDGDPCDIMVIAPVPVVPGAVICCRPVGALVMKDQAGPGENPCRPRRRTTPVLWVRALLRRPAGDPARPDRAFL